MTGKIVFKEQSYRIIGACFEVYKENSKILSFTSIRRVTAKLLVKNGTACSNSANKTAEDLLKEGRAQDVKDYLSRIAAGGYA